MCVSKATEKQYFRRVYSAAKKSDRSAGNGSAPGSYFNEAIKIGLTFSNGIVCHDQKWR